MPETFQRKDVSFSREDFFAGGPIHKEVPIEIRVEDGRVPRGVPEVSRLLYKYTNMLVQSVSAVDAERTQYLLSSNDTVKLYTFDRSVTVLALQAVIVDGVQPQQEQANEPPHFNQDAFEQFMWLYEHELKVSESVRKNRRIVVRVNELDHEVLVTNYSDGFASQGEWLVMVNLELLVLNSQLISLGPAGMIRQGTSGKDVLSTASRELLYNLSIGDEPTTPVKVGGATNKSIAAEVRRSKRGVQQIDQA